MMPKVNWNITRLLAAVQDCAVTGADLWQHEATRHFDMALGLAEARRQGLLSAASATSRPALTRAGWAQAAAAARALAPLTAALRTRAEAEAADRVMARHADALRAAEMTVGRHD